MLKYKETYFVEKQKDNNSKSSENKDDNYIRCKKKVQIYRYDTNILCVQFNSNKYANARIKELSEIGIGMKAFQIGTDEQTYLFPEPDLSKVADIVKAKKRIKRDLTDEQRVQIKQRLQSTRKMNS